DDQDRRRQRIDEEADRELEVAGDEPLVDVAVEHVAGLNVARDDYRGHERRAHAEDAQPVRDAAPELRTPQTDDDRRDERRKRHQQVEPAHVGDLHHPRSLPCASTSSEPVLRNSSTRIARPIADSAAATVRMKNTNTCPAMSPRWYENAMKLRLTASSISSIAISRMMTFLRLRKMPAMLIANRIAPRIR